MKILLYISTLCLLISCGSSSNNNVSEETTSKVEECLQSSISDYYSKEELILELLVREGILEDTRESYAGLCNQMFSESIGHFEISQEERKKLEFLDTFGPHARISQCANVVQSDVVLTKNQVEFYTWFYDSARSGSLDNASLSGIITKMSDEEFDAFGIRETTLFFCGHEIIRNHFLH